MIENRVIDECMYELGTGGFAVYCAIVRFTNRDKTTWPAYARLAALLGVSRRTISRTVNKLVDLGLIEVKRRPGRNSVYQLTNLPTHEIRESEDGSYVQLQDTAQIITKIDPCHQGTAGGSLVSPPQFRGVFTPSTLHVGVLQDTTTTPTPGVGGVVENGSITDPRIAQLVAQGVREDVARGLAPRVEAPLLEVILAYYEAGAGSAKPVYPGLLVEMCRAPAKYGFHFTPNGWQSPKLPTRRTSAIAPPAKPAKSIDERRAEAAAARERMAEAEKCHAANRSRLFNDQAGPYNARR